MPKDLTLCIVIRCDKPIAPTSKKHCAEHAASIQSNRRARKPCQKPGCPALVDGDKRVCEAHRKDDPRRKFDRARQDDWLRRERQTARWSHFRKWFLRLNVICQRLHFDGQRWVQCQNLATLLHHRENPRENLDAMYDATKIVALCTDCHHPGQGDTGDERYVPTKTG
jgi:hypothetical protein